MEPALLQLLRYLVLTFRALKRAAADRVSKLPALVGNLVEQLVLPEPDTAPLPPEGAMPFDEADIQSLSQVQHPLLLSCATNECTVFIYGDAELSLHHFFPLAERSVQSCVVEPHDRLYFADTL